MPSKTALIHAGDLPDVLYYIIRGSVEVMIEDEDGNEMVLTWHDENFTLQETDRLDLPESWHDSTATVNVASGTITARVPIVAGSMFYRLAL